jgi:cell division septum initiation protein DivIVA
MTDPECVVTGCKAAENGKLIAELLAENGRLERRVEELEKELQTERDTVATLVLEEKQ